MKISNCRRRGNRLQLDLFDWQPPMRAPLPLAAEHIARRFRLEPSLAVVVAQAAGFNVEDRQ